MVAERVHQLEPMEVVQRVADAIPLPVYCCSRAGKLLFANDITRSLKRPAAELERELVEAAQPCGNDERWLRRELKLETTSLVLLIFLGEPRSMTRAVLLAAAAFGLTDGQTRVLLHVAEDPHTGRVARQMKLSEHTVKRYREQLYAKTGTRSMAHLIRKLVNFIR